MAAQHRQQSPTLAEFKHLLKTKWTSKVACQDNCHDPESPCPDRRFVHVAELEAWWKRTASDATLQRKIDRLFDEYPLGEPHQLYEDSQSYSNACLRVLSLLLEHDLGHCIKRFYDSNMHDRYLERGEGYQSLRLNLNKIIPSLSNVDEIIQIFHNAKWAYCPLEFSFHMDTNLQGTEVIVPFCRKIRLGNKGGTASVYWVAVQKDLIRDDALRNALRRSLVIDPDFGECYQMALKSYIGNKEHVYELERNAFSGLNLNSEVPIVRCLGCYSHDYGEGSTSADPEMRKTYNLLLEYGERDLYEYWADETNIPPVRAEEIIVFWDSLFEVAKALRHVHNLEIPRERGVSRRFHGWHADIKPDNILRVHGQFKLADFGYSKFAPVTDSKRVPTEFIDGFTDTYGAPEVSRAKRPDGTISEVTQSIDTWSFGCVLSVAATWVVLGFQGVRQYEKLRRRSPTNNKHGKIFDRFHNGTEVLPEVRRWHDYLRGHLRCSDTMTSHVLRLVENDMLQTSVQDRLPMTSLCSELDGLVRIAKGEIGNLSRFSRDTDEAVLRALLEVEQDAEKQNSSKPKSTPLNPAPLPQQHPENTRPLQKTSKTERLKSIPLGHTTYRKPIILKELRSNVIIKKDDGNAIEGAHDGAITESPVNDQPTSGLPGVEREKPRHPRLQHKDRDEPNAPQKPLENRVETGRPNNADVVRTGTGMPSRQAQGDIATPVHESISQGKQPMHSYNQRAKDYSHHFNGSPQRPVYASVREGGPMQGMTDDVQPGKPQTSRDLPIPGFSAATVRENSAGHADRTAHATNNVLRNVPSHPTAQYSALGLPNAPSSHANTENNPDRSSPHILREQYSGGYVRPYYAPYATDAAVSMARSTSSSSKEQAEPRDVYSSQVPELATPTPRRAQSGIEPVYELTSSRTPHGSPSNPQPDIFVTQPNEIGTSVSSPTSPPSATFTGRNQALAHNQTPPTARSSQYLRLPSSALDLRYPICVVRKEVDAVIPKGVRAGVKGFLGLEQRKADRSLAETYGDKREIIFVLDNGASMLKHWPIVIFVAETLAKKASGLDKDGVDLMFTIDNAEHHRFGLKGEEGREKFRKALYAAQPDNSDSMEHHTDMHHTLSEIVTRWTEKGCKPTTLIILTDGIWRRTMTGLVDNVIINLAQEVTKHQRAGKRKFGIQFIRFDECCVEKLTKLDDELCKSRGLGDIVDHCSWRATVDKMFKGSITGEHDELNSEELGIPFNYDELIALFRRFNENSDAAKADGLLAPTPSHSSLSRSSSGRSSSPGSRWRDSAPLERTPSRRRESWQSHSRQPFSA